MEYTTHKVNDDGRTIIVEITLNGENHTLPIQIPSDTMHASYMRPSPALIVDSEGVGIYQPRLCRPHCPLPPEYRECTQWEFDKFCYENPDSREGMDCSFDRNAAVYEAAMQEYSKKLKY